MDDLSGYYSLGDSCLAASILKETGLRQHSGPFDWIAGLPYLEKLTLINNNFAGMLDKNDLEYQNKTTPEGTIFVKNLRNNALFIHDFRNNSTDEFNAVTEKYRRRQSRFLSNAKNKNIYFLYIGSNDNFDYVRNINLIINKTIQIKNKIGAQSLSAILCIKNTQTNNYCDIYQKDKCAIIIQHYDATILKPKEWTPQSKLNDLAKKAISIASTME